VKPLRPKDPLASLPKGWKGTFQVNSDSHVQNSGGTADAKDVYQGTVEWGAPGDSDLPPLPLFGGRTYVPIAMSLTVTSTIDQKSTDGGYCTGHGTGTTSVPLDGSLELNGRGRYFGELSALLSFEVTQTCVGADGKTQTGQVPFTGILALAFNGKQVYGMHGNPAPFTVNYGEASARLKRSWDFTAVR
jgi:hypothetical protein